MTVGSLLAQGGWAMLPIYLCSVAALVVFLRKLLAFRAARLGELDWFPDVEAQLAAGDLDGAEDACRRTPNPGARVVAATIRALQERPDRAEAEARRVGSVELQALESHLGLLAFIAQAAPLLGLLGTVIGMVDLFMSLQGAGQANVSVSQLSSGIWKALLTTAAGLTVAVPSLAGHSYLTSRTDRTRLRFADLIQRTLFVAPERTGRDV